MDLDSLTPFAALRDDTAVYAALQWSVEALRNTVRALVAGSTDPARAESTKVRIDLHHIDSYLTTLLREAIQSEARSGLELDARARSYFMPNPSFAELVTQLGTYYSPANPAFAERARAFHEFGLTLLRSLR